MRKIFINEGIFSKDGKLINRMKLLFFWQAFREHKEIMAEIKANKFDEKRAERSQKKFFIDAGICSKDGKLISKKKYNEFQQMMAEMRTRRLGSQKVSKKLLR